MPFADPTHRRLRIRHVLLALAALPLLVAASSAPVSKVASTGAGSILAGGEPATLESMAIINVSQLAAEEAAREADIPELRKRIFRRGLENPTELEAPGDPSLVIGGEPTSSQGIGTRLFVASPSPTTNYMGLDDIPMADSNYIIIPPDIAGGVGPNKVMESFNNNYRIRDKATGATQLTMGTATFWAAVTNANERTSLTDPRATYDPYNNRWIVCMQTVLQNAVVLVGVSQTSDPAGGWFLYRFSNLSGTLGGNYLLDFPNLGFNKNWVAVTINRYTTAGAFSYGICLALNYPQLRLGAGAGSLFSGAAGTHFSTAPAVTYSSTQDSLFLVTHLSSAGATYAVDVITGTPAAPVYNLGPAAVRPGGGWVQPSGNLQPQSAPNVGASACGVTPCRIESQDAQIRSAPVYRNGFIWYAQTVGLPAGALTHTAAQWTKITPSTTPAFADGGRLDDPTANATNGGKWYTYPSLSVNASNDMMLGFTQFASNQHPSAGYAMRLGVDALGTLRDPFIYKVGDDYYHKTFTTTTGRNRWGDFSTVQVDPCDDQTLWTLQQYAKTRTGVDDGNTGSNSSRWSSWWAAVAGIQPVASVVCPFDTSGAPGATVTRKFRIVNGGTATGTFNYTVTDVSGWGGPVAGTTPPLAPASFFDVFVDFDVPSNCSPVSDQVTFTAQVVGPTGCYSSVTCNTVVYCDIITASLVSSFNANTSRNGVELTWWSDATSQVRSWKVYRAPSPAGGWTPVTHEPIAMNSGGRFDLIDTESYELGTYYRLSAVMADGREQFLSSTQVGGSVREISFAVTGANPFAGATFMRYALPRRDHVKLEVFNITGQRVRTLVNRDESPGEYAVEFSLRGDGLALAPGVYLARLMVGRDTRTLRLVARE